MQAQAGVLHQQLVRRRHDVPILRRAGILPAIVLAIVLVLQLWVRLESIHAGYRLEGLRSQALKNDARLRELRFELAALSSPVAVETEAKSRLGFVSPAPQNVRRLSIHTAQGE